MEVAWTFEPRGDGTTLVRIVHDWADGPRWPLPRALRRLVARLVIGPVFVSAVAKRTLAGIARAVEADPAP
jgi:hypothetical protein